MTAYTPRFPLQWPAGWPRSGGLLRAPFKVTPSQAEKEMLAELDRLGAREIVISTDRRVNRDGTFSVARQNIWDHGVAVYFKRAGRDVVLACDKYDRIHDNVRAIGKTIEAMRGIERWGASDMLDRAFAGFEALPAPEQWWEVLGVARTASADEVHTAYRAAAKALHDRGASDGEFARLNVARDAARAEQQ